MGWLNRAKRSDSTATGATLTRARASRMAWLIEHPDIWAGAPSDSQDVDDAGRAKLYAVGQILLQEGLYSPHTSREDRIWGIRVLIGEARRRTPADSGRSRHWSSGFDALSVSPQHPVQ